MSVQGATIKRLQFLTARWEYDIPHKFVWALDMYGVEKSNIDTILNQYERRKSTNWPVKDVISIETVRDQLGFVGLAQSVAFPNEGFEIDTMPIENSGGLIAGLAGSKRYAYGSSNKLDVSFLETNTDIIDYFIKPWIIAASHKGLIEDGNSSTNIKATIEAYLYARSIGRNFVPTLRKHITFHNCVPFVATPDEISYGEMGINDITKTVSFAFQRYTVNNI
jgi:hypothetical protein